MPTDNIDNVPPPMKPAAPARTYRATLIDPVLRMVQEVQVIDDHTAIVDALNCRLFDLVRLTPDGTEVMAVDDEGRLVYPNPNGYFRFVHPYTREPISDWICGRGLVMGNNPDTGTATDSGLLLQTIKSAVHFADEPPPREEVKPVFVFHSMH